MTSPLRRHTAGLAAALFTTTLALTACGTNGESGSDGETSSAAPSESAQAFPVTVPSDAGDITLTEKPEKIVVVGANRYVDVLASLDEAPDVFSGGVDEQRALEWSPWIEGMYGEWVDGLLTADWDPDVEAIAALAPDLVVLQNNGADETVLQQLSQVAPVYTEDSPRNWADAVTNMGKATGKSELAAQVIDETNAEFAAARERIAGLQGKTYLAGWASDQDGSFWPFPEMGTFADELGLVKADNMPVLPDRGTPISKENLDLITADVVLVSSNDGHYKEFESDPRFAEMPAVTNGTMVLLEPLIGIAQTTDVGPASVPWLLERILPVLEKSALNTGE